MNGAHLFEFMDQPWLAASLRTTLREILECGNAAPFRGYYAWAAGEARRVARARGLTTIVERGAGTAPLTRHLARMPGPALRLVPCDLAPDLPAYRALAERYPATVAPIYEATDFSQPQAWPRDALLVLSATFHHIPVAERGALLGALAASTDVLILEPLRRTPLSLLFVLLSLVPALVLPLWFIHRPGRLRRLFWCWLVPLAPLLFVWDGIVSCLREWTAAEWRRALGEQPKLRERLFVQAVLIASGEIAVPRGSDVAHDVGYEESRLPLTART